MSSKNYKSTTDLKSRPILHRISETSIFSILILLSVTPNTRSFTTTPSFLPHRVVSVSGRTSAVTALNQRSNKNNQEDTFPLGTTVELLGKGSEAKIYPGAVLVAPKYQNDHFLRRAAIFIHGIGLDEYGEHVTRGVILDNPTPFTIGEMAPGTVYGSLASNLLFRGGGSGTDKVMMLHSCLSISDRSRAIGSAGIYEGGLQAALEMVDDDEIEVECVKFFFNYVEFTEGEMKAMLSDEGDDQDCWMSLEISSDLILDSDLDRGELWKGLRNRVQQMTG